MKFLSRGLIAAFLLSTALASPALAVNATVRVEGESSTLLERTPVEVPTAGTFGPEDCPYGTAGGAIEVGTGGNWDRLRYTKLILGERHDYSQDGDYWALWVNNDYQETSGVCDYALQPGDEVLMLPDPGAASEPYIGRYPLGLQGVPATARTGEQVTVTAVQFDNDANPAPAAGVTVTASDGQTATSGADGRVSFTFASAGNVTLKARRTNNAPSAAEPISVTTEAVAGAPATQPGQALAPLYVDRDSPRATFDPDIVTEQQRFSRRRAPRQLRGTASDVSGILMVKLKLTRNKRGRCSAYSASRERFVRRPCGAAHGWWFKVAEGAEWQYLLPKRLPRGRYVLDVNAIDRAYNRDDQRRRGQNRVVFHVGRR